MSKFPAWRRWLLVVGLGGVTAIAVREGRERASTGRETNATPAMRDTREVRAGRELRAAPVHAAAAPIAHGEAGRALFTWAQPANAAELSAKLPAPSDDARYVRIDRALLVGKRSPFWRASGEGRLTLPLPEGGSLVVVIDGSTATGAGEFTSRGRIEGRPLGRAVFAACGGFLHASIEDPELGAYALRAATEEFSQFYRIDAGRLAPCGGERRAASAGGAGAPLAFPAETAVENPQRAEIHVMMVHTQAALPTLAGQARRDALRSAFLAALEKVNAAFEASLVSARVRLVAVHETQFPGDDVREPARRWQDDALTALQATHDGAMDDVHAARDAAGADIVCLALQRPDFASSGLSFLLQERGRFDNPDYAFSVVQYGNMAGTNVVAHELGHVLGCAHDRANAVNGEGAFPYSFGYRFLGSDGRQYHDIMAYPPGIELSYFSNPAVTVPAPVNAAIGVPAGRPGESDTARTIEQTAFATASYRLQTQAAAGAGSLIQVATRAHVGRGEAVLIGGFTIDGARPRQVLVRAAGPALRAFGVADALADPVLRIFAGGTRVAENDNWSGADTLAAAGRVGAFPFAADSADAAAVVSLAPGAYTAVIEGAGGGTGSALLEVYDVEPGGTDRLINVATRGYADNTGHPMQGGFTVRGAPGETKRILVRVLGPSLAQAPYRMNGVLDDPVLQLRNAAGELLLENDDWSSDSTEGTGDDDDFNPVVETHGERAIFATGHAPPNRREPCVLVDLPPGGYTVTVQPFELRSADLLEDQPAVPGLGIVEVYEVAR